MTSQAHWHSLLDKWVVEWWPIEVAYTLLTRTYFLKALVLLALLKGAMILTTYGIIWVHNNVETTSLYRIENCQFTLVGDVVMTHIIKGYVSCCRLTITPGYVKWYEREKNGLVSVFRQPRLDIPNARFFLLIVSCQPNPYHHLNFRRFVYLKQKANFHSNLKTKLPIDLTDISSAY